MRQRTLVFLAWCGAVASLSLTASAQQRPAPKPGISDAFQKLLAQAQGSLAGRPSSATAPASTAPGGSQPLAIDWAAAGSYARSGPAERGRGINARFIAANKPAIDTVTIPVLLPGDPDLAAGLRFFPNGAFYTVSSRVPGMAFTLTGAGRAFPLPPATARALPNGLAGRIPPDGIVIETGESGIDASFTRFGAAYSISLACDNPAADPRCASEAYIRGVISRLTVVIPAQGG